jgi:hypothetical protein
MDDDVKSRCDQLDKRIDDVRALVTTVLSIIGGIVALLTLIANQNLQTERQRIKDVAGELTEKVQVALGQAGQRAEVKILGQNGKELTGQILPGEVQTEASGNKSLVLRFVLKNVGTKATEPLFFKIYSSDPLRLGSPSTDEAEFRYEDFIPPADVNPSILPAGVSLRFATTHRLLQEGQLTPGNAMMVLKVYYGGGDATESRFQVQLP